MINNALIDSVMDYVRVIGEHCLNASDEPSKQVAAKTLGRILRLFEKSSLRCVVDVPTELVRLVVRKAGKSSVQLAEEHVLALIKSITEDAVPLDALKALSMIDTQANFYPEVFSLLHILLLRGASSGSELSASLLNIRKSRLRRGGHLLNQPNAQLTDHDREIGNPPISLTNIWKSMSTGTVVIEK